MALQILDRTISVISIIDDEPIVRETYEFPVEELDVEPRSEEGPLNDLDAFVKETAARSQAVLCDYHLKVKNYSTFNGAELAAAYYQYNIPAVLCTRWEEAMLEEIRDYRRFIPSLLKPMDLTPEAIQESLKVCITELHGEFLPTRKPWRTLVRIEETEADANEQHSLVFVVVPAWNPGEVVRLRLGGLPDNVKRQAIPGARLFAHVNIGAERPEDLYFSNWE